MQTERTASWHGVDGIVVSPLSDGIADALSARRLNETFDQIARYIRELIGAHQSAVSYIPDGDFSRAISGMSLSDKYARYRTYDVLPTGKGIWGVIFETARPMRLTENELNAHPRFLKFSDLKDARGLEHPPMVGWLAVPVLKRNGEAIGVLQLTDRYEGNFTEEDEALLQKAAVLVAPTMETEYLYQQVQQQKQQLQHSNEELQAQRLAALNLAQDAEEARKQAEQSEERLNLALKSSGVGTWSWNVVENSIIWDDFIHPLFGLKPGTFPGHYEDFLRTLHTEDRERVAEEVARAVEEDAVYDTEYQVVWPDGSVHVLGSRGKVYRNAAGRALRMTGVCWDITERKRAQETMARQAEELASSNKDLEQFAYVASHDLQEPLRAVAGFCQLLEQRYGERLDEQAREFIHHAVEGAERMKELIGGLLEYSRIGTRGALPETVDATQAVESALANLQVAIQETGAVVHYGKLPAVTADRSQMIRLFQNLIGNAIKYRGALPPEIQIAAIRNGGEWIFSVQDKGIGFDVKHAPRIFLIFQRLHTREKYPGTGIGLAICERIVQRHGGRIWAVSAPGQGSTFYFTLSHQGAVRA